MRKGDTRSKFVLNVFISIILETAILTILFLQRPPYGSRRRTTTATWTTSLAHQRQVLRVKVVRAVILLIYLAAWARQRCSSRPGRSLRPARAQTCWKASGMPCVSIILSCTDCRSRKSSYKICEFLQSNPVFSCNLPVIISSLSALFLPWRKAFAYCSNYELVWLLQGILLLKQDWT